MTSDDNFRRAPRIGHKKSRKGCLTCRSRRVKCDESHPECRTCHRLGLECRYPGGSPAAAESNSSPSSNSQSSPNATSSNGTLPRGANKYSFITKFYENASSNPDDDIGESRPRRMMELRILHFWTSKFSGPNEGWQQIWGQEVPRLALQNDHVLYSLLAFAATQLLVLCPDDTELAVARQTYWTMALREQQVVLSNPHSRDPEVTAFAAFLIESTSFALLHERDLEPYSPPLGWLQVGKGASVISPKVDNLPENSILRRLVDICAPLWQNESDPENVMLEPDHQRILDPSLSYPELSDPDAVNAYKIALRSITYFRRAVRAGEPGYVQLRRVAMFPTVVPAVFHDYVRECRPRALVVLAYFFAAVAQSNTLVYFGNPDKSIARREVEAIARFLPPEWQEFMAGPLEDAFVKTEMR